MRLKDEKENPAEQETKLNGVGDLNLDVLSD